MRGAPARAVDPVVSHWRVDGDRLTLEVELPINSSAIVRVPTHDPASVTERGRSVSAATGITALPADPKGGARFEVGAGRYVFSAAVRRR